MSQVSGPPLDVDPSGTAVNRRTAVKRARRVGAYLGDLWRRREFAWFLAMGNLKARNATTALGLLWWVLNPLMLGMVYFLVFGILFPSQRDLGYLLVGMFVFHYSAQALTGGANSILQNSKLLANLRFPRLILPIANLIEASFGFLVSLVVLYAIAIPAGSMRLNANVLLFFAIFPIHFVLNLGLGATAARLAVPFRDINNIIPYLTRLWLYMSPIIWPLSFVDRLSPTLQTVIQWNPLWWIIAVYRSVLLGDEFNPRDLMWSALSAIVVAVLGVGLFVKYESRMVRHL